MGLTTQEETIETILAVSLTRKLRSAQQFFFFCFDYYFAVLSREWRRIAATERRTDKY